uniref:ABA4-like family protein n=1 Tax=Parerythrobacter lutipelagi TaxID=1964208 RepID=UPI0010F7107D|nr:ABA4-like family protein [Parerythrobacter lutipelagi]
MWDAIFGAVNVIAIVCWIGLTFLPRWPTLLAFILYCGVGLLCLVYAVFLFSIVAGWLDPVGPADAAANFSTIEGVRGIFLSDGGVTVGWTHYLAFDLFVGLWIARDADAKQFNRIVQAPVLLATFLAGPLGLLVWLIVRERRARKLGRPS